MLTDQPVTPITEADRWEAFILRFCDNRPLYGGTKHLRDLWQEHGDAVLAEWVLAHPGTRPSCWWRYSAPDLRQDVPDKAEQRRYLIEKGLLTPAERKRRDAR